MAENDLIEMTEEFSIFERNKVPLEIKLGAVAIYILSSLLWILRRNPSTSRFILRGMLLTAYSFLNRVSFI
ncbi:MAG: hypothetical protein ACXQTM_08115 [Methanosarcinales archaeon]